MFPVHSASMSSLKAVEKVGPNQSFKDAMNNPYKYTKMPMSPMLKMSINRKYNKEKPEEKTKKFVINDLNNAHYMRSTESAQRKSATRQNEEIVNSPMISKPKNNALEDDQILIKKSQKKTKKGKKHNLKHYLTKNEPKEQIYINEKIIESTPLKNESAKKIKSSKRKYDKSSFIKPQTEFDINLYDQRQQFYKQIQPALPQRSALLSTQRIPATQIIEEEIAISEPSTKTVFTSPYFNNTMNIRFENEDMTSAKNNLDSRSKRSASNTTSRSPYTKSSQRSKSSTRHLETVKSEEQNGQINVQKVKSPISTQPMVSSKSISSSVTTSRFISQGKPKSIKSQKSARSKKSEKSFKSDSRNQFQKSNNSHYNIFDERSMSGTSVTNTESHGQTDKYLREFINEGKRRQTPVFSETYGDKFLYNSGLQSAYEQSDLLRKEIEIKNLYEKQLEQQKLKYYQQLAEKEEIIKQLNSKVNQLEETVQKERHSNVYDSKHTAKSDQFPGSLLNTLSQSRSTIHGSPNQMRNSNSYNQILFDSIGNINIIQTSMVSNQTHSTRRSKVDENIPKINKKPPKIDKSPIKTPLKKEGKHYKSTKSPNMNLFKPHDDLVGLDKVWSNLGPAWLVPDSRKMYSEKDSKTGLYFD